MQTYWCSRSHYKNCFMSDNINYSINIIKKRKVVCNRRWLAYDILLAASKFKWIFFFRPVSKCVNFLVYVGIIAAIREYKVRINIQLTAVRVDHHTKRKQINTVKTGQIWGRSSCCWKVDGKFAVQLQWKKIFLKCIQTTMDRQLRWFSFSYYIVLHQQILLLCRICLSLVHTFCNHEDDTMSHLFWPCLVT